MTGSNNFNRFSRQVIWTCKYKAETSSQYTLL